MAWTSTQLAADKKVHSGMTFLLEKGYGDTLAKLDLADITMSGYASSILHKVLPDTNGLPDALSLLKIDICDAYAYGFALEDNTEDYSELSSSLWKFVISQYQPKS